MSNSNQFEGAPRVLLSGFRNSVASARNLAQLQKQIPAAIYNSLLRFLCDSPDPDTTIILLDRLLKALPSGSTASFVQNVTLLHHACLVLGCSPWLGEALIRNVDLLRRLGSRWELSRSFTRDEFRDEFARFHVRWGGGDLSTSLARFRKCEYVRILVRDLTGMANLAEVIDEISALSDALLEEALRYASAGLSARYGSPIWVDSAARRHDSRCAILSLGKLGGCELNYSSDVDLLFLFDAGEDAAQAQLSNPEYFALLAQKVTELLSRQTPEGQPFRIDLRLRPHGHEGSLAVRVAQAIRYYNETAADWELQAMLKARHSAGNVELSREFIRAIAPSVYRPDVNFTAVKTALQARERIDQRGKGRRASGLGARAIDIKLDRGGIRDIEFLVQCLQRVYGGQEAWLRSRGTLYALQKLHDKEHINGADFHRLTKAYEFLRTMEHRLQLRRGRQCHQLPSGDAELSILARYFHHEISVTSPDAFLAYVCNRMAEVWEIYERVVYHGQSGDEPAPERPRTVEIAVSAEASYSQVLQRLAEEAPALLARIRRTRLSQHGWRGLARFLSSAATSAERFARIGRFQDAFDKALQIFEYSDYLTELLIRHPLDAQLLQAADACAGDVKQEVHAESVAARQQFRREVLLANANDLFEPQDIWQVLKANSDAADDALRRAMSYAEAPAGFAVMALGRLGSREFDVLSDADVLFVANDCSDRSECQKAAEQIMELLTAYTKEGTVFPLDTRLRPQGAQGELVTTPQMLERYFEREAKPWEAISYLRLRFVAGDPAVGEHALQSVRAGIAELANRTNFAQELREMRVRLEASDARPNFETGAGGMFDIDFLTGRIQLEHCLWSHGNLNERIDALQTAGVLPTDEVEDLRSNAAFLRALEHYIRLVTGRVGKSIPSNEHSKSKIEELMKRYKATTGERPLRWRLEQVLGRNREIFQQYLFN